VFLLRRSCGSGRRCSVRLCTLPDRRIGRWRRGAHWRAARSSPSWRGGGGSWSLGRCALLLHGLRRWSSAAFRNRVLGRFASGGRFGCGRCLRRGCGRRRRRGARRRLSLSSTLRRRRFLDRRHWCRSDSRCGFGSCLGALARPCRRRFTFRGGRRFGRRICSPGACRCRRAGRGSFGSGRFGRGRRSGRRALGWLCLGRLRFR
jgi:hypothetical protein